MNTHISKELAQWLKERGCEVESVWISELNGSIISEEEYYDFQDYAGSVGKPEGSSVERFYPSYSWYDILVTHAKEFWGEEDYFCAECREQIYDEDGCQNMKCQTENHEIVAHLFYPEYLLELLQNGLVEEAENEVREHSLFANPTTL